MSGAVWNAPKSRSECIPVDAGGTRCGGFEFNLDALRRKVANDNGSAEHGVMLRSLIWW